MPRVFRTPVVAAPRMSNDRYGRYLEAPDIQNLNEAAAAALFREFMVFGPVFTAQVWTDMPAAVTPLYNLTALRLRTHLDGATDIRLVVTPGAVLGATNATLRIQYTLDLTGAAGWTNIDGLADDAGAPRTVGGAVRLDTATASVPNVGATNNGWVAVAAAAKTGVLLRVVGQDGDATVDPTFHAVRIQVR